MDLAHSRIEDLLRAAENDKKLLKFDSSQSLNGNCKCNGMSQLHSKNSEDHCSSDDTSQGIDKTPIRIAEDLNHFHCIEKNASADQESGYESDEGNTGLSESVNGFVIERDFSLSLPRQVNASSNGYSYRTLEERIQDVHKTIDSLTRSNHDSLSSESSPSTSTTCSGITNMSRRSRRTNLITDSPNFETAEQSESTPPTILDNNSTGRPEDIFARKQWKLPPVIYGAESARLSRNDSLSSDSTSYVYDLKSQDANEDEDDIPTLGSFVAGLREMAQTQKEHQVQDQEIGRRETEDLTVDAMHDWPLKFAKLRKLIIELWHDSNVSLVHRTYFILLIKGDVKDSIYVEVEHRRLLFLKDTFSRADSAIHNGRPLTLASSRKALHRERAMLSRLMYKRCSENERNRIYDEWGISLSSKRRRSRLVHLLWGDTENMDHAMKSAAVVAKLIGLSENGHALQEMFGLSFTPPTRVSRRISFGWKK